MFGKSIRIYLSDDSPSGLRHLEIANWSWCVVKILFDFIKKIIKLDWDIIKNWNNNIKI